MYEIEEPKFVIKLEFDRKLLLNKEPDLSVFCSVLKEDFHQKWKGIRFKVELIHKFPYVVYFIYFPSMPHKTVVRKILNWIKRTYKITSLDISNL